MDHTILVRFIHLFLQQQKIHQRLVIAVFHRAQTKIISDKKSGVMKKTKNNMKSEEPNLRAKKVVKHKSYQ